IDTGVDYTHEDLAANMWVNSAEQEGTEGVDDDGNGYIDDIYGVDTTATGKKAGNPMDDHGHGTHVAGIIGMTSNGEGGIGLAYGAKIMAIKAGQSTGTLASSHIAKAINYAHMMGADVINMSFGGTGKSYLVETALEDAFSDCVLVASAGNDGIPTTDAPDIYPQKADIYPAGYSYVIGVMATDKNGNLASFSNWDYKPNENCEYEMTAPGKDIYSALPGNRYAKWSGTSMAAPFVAAGAAIIRSHYTDKDMYSSRFIMGQLASATTDTTYYVSKDGSYNYPAFNIYDSLYYLPKPNISVSKTFLMDNTENDEANDGDAIIDAGEVIDLGITVRNQWGQTGDITVTADVISDGGVENPWVEFITDEVTLQPAGTFAEVNNGYVYDDSLLVAIDNPIRFRISPETPNDTQIKINLTVTTTNGYDMEDDAEYTTDASHTFRVQAGRGISGTLTEDTTLTNDYLWIIENTLLVPEGITLTIEPGTKVQFYSSDYEDAYGQKTVAAINNEGIFNAIGTEDEPIEMYPGVGFEKYCVVIYGNGVETLKYCNVINPKLGIDTKRIDVLDHNKLTQIETHVYYRQVYSNLTVEEKLNNIPVYAYYMYNSQMMGFAKGTNNVELNIQSIINCLFDSSKYVLSNSNDYNSKIIERYYENNVFLSEANNISKNEEPRVIKYPRGVYESNLRATSEIFTFAESKYVRISGINGYFTRIKVVEEMLGGKLVSINTKEEEEFLRNNSLNGMIGYLYNPLTNKYEWNDDSLYELTFDDFKNPPIFYPYATVSNGRIYNGTTETSVYNLLIEFPATISDEQITENIKKMDNSIVDMKGTNFISNNAILNPVLNNNPNTWVTLSANNYASNQRDNYLYNNYWGTENKTLINKMIVDGDDFPGTYQDIIEDPILTLESESLSDIYPFVTKVYMTDDEGNIVSNVQPGGEYEVHVHFNRDMDTDTQPAITYGPATPYTDYMVEGEFVSAREWVGTTRISPVLTNGTMYFRTKGGCAADDKWLVCGEDILRFSFNVSANGVLAMMLNAEGGANRVELSWAQNDYDTLAGYNLYRSETEDGTYKKLNTSIISDTEYTDTDVKPGVTYYYYFKVVNTDGNEEASVSNTASAAPIDNIFPVLKHSPVTGAKAGNQITISATATDNIEVAAVKLYYKTAGDSQFKTKEMTLSATANLYVSVIPADAVKAAGVEYYVTAGDADGNVSYSGTQQVPHRIEVNSAAYISGVTPSKIAMTGGKTITILGGNFDSDMVIKLGGTEITEYSVIDSGQINFVAPAKASGSYALTITTADGKTVTAPTPVSYTDAGSIAQIPTNITMVSGTPYEIPFYVSSSSEMVSLHAELDLPASDFTKVEVTKADEDAPFQLAQSYSGGVLKIGCIGTEDFTPEDGALFIITVTPKVTADKQYTLKLHDVSVNGAPVSTMISADAIIKQGYELLATVKYYAGEKAAVEGVKITASGISALTSPEGIAKLLLSSKNVTVSANHNAEVTAISAYDASLVLQAAVDKTTLTDNQKLAADVDGNGLINEYDAALILQKSVRKIDVFPIGTAWLFTPSYIEKTLTTATNTVEFAIIAVGDVDGSFRGDAE
ncbi:MAG: S8 family serine peptidase, partial [Clostridia bacterium]|nr:S8 family serine peptidase [Clostridia bacterium]